MDFNILNIFWIFLILSSLQPIVRQKMLEWARNRAIRNFEEKRTVRQILSSRGTEGIDADELAEALASGRWTHDYPISLDEAQELGLQVTIGMPEEIYELMNLFPQTRQRRPSVQFIPMPYTERPTRRSPADGNSR
jgi:ClpP class serine protease